MIETGHPPFKVTVLFAEAARPAFRRIRRGRRRRFASAYRLHCRTLRLHSCRRWAILGPLARCKRKGPAAVSELPALQPPDLALPPPFPQSPASLYRMGKSAIVL
jgi:hypothetical protein